jgi:hypothetical protein
MIRNDAELQIVRQQLARVEDGLAKFRKDSPAPNPRQFELFAEPHFEMMRRLRSEIDAYVGATPAPGGFVVTLPDYCGTELTVTLAPDDLVRIAAPLADPELVLHIRMKSKETRFTVGDKTYGVTVAPAEEGMRVRIRAILPSRRASKGPLGGAA